MDEMLIFRKMESLGWCVDRIRSKRGFTHEELFRNFFSGHERMIFGKVETSICWWR